MGDLDMFIGVEPVPTIKGGSDKMEEPKKEETPAEGKKEEESLDSIIGSISDVSDDMEKKAEDVKDAAATEDVALMKEELVKTYDVLQKAQGDLMKISKEAEMYKKLWEDSSKEAGEYKVKNAEMSYFGVVPQTDEGINVVRFLNEFESGNKDNTKKLEKVLESLYSKVTGKSFDDLSLSLKGPMDIDNPESNGSTKSLNVGKDDSSTVIF